MDVAITMVDQEQGAPQGRFAVLIFAILQHYVNEGVHFPHNNTQHLYKD